MCGRRRKGRLLPRPKSNIFWFKWRRRRPPWVSSYSAIGFFINITILLIICARHGCLLVMLPALKLGLLLPARSHQKACRGGRARMETPAIADQRPMHSSRDPALSWWLRRVVNGSLQLRPVRLWADRYHRQRFDLSSGHPPRIFVCPLVFV